ncbi:hypothetical protein GCM10010495_25500 [Kitasatospora herbaricolor]|uniref:hypothetical protein n=1 Tax=Kitasatospora herbaricolor TaxID=68217 RepID=UPI00174D5FC7|nr:hypothetical protein [Kitasatospora herbaricolor]MDQ0311247.1 hypothetical protein [Kitasatospora herbaricolor]GGV11105.1 hypothetical protein GCM10010495_25500 [Kitasatospora herbaricolor]
MPGAVGPAGAGRVLGGDRIPPGRRARVLHLEGRALADAGSHQEAAGKLAEAAGLRRADAERDRRSGGARMSATLDLYATVRARLDRHEEAVAATDETVGAAERQLARLRGEGAPGTPGRPWGFGC